MMYYWIQTLLVGSVVLYSVVYLLRTLLPMTVSRAQSWLPRRLSKASAAVPVVRGCGISCHACKGCSLARLHKAVKSVTSHT